jgi:Arc/MetJ-type ribon-helix-helix transcriptional regulator
MSEKPQVEQKPQELYGYYISANLVLTREQAGKLQALLNAGVSKSDIVRFGINLLLEKKPQELLETLGLAKALEKPEAVPLDMSAFAKLKPEEIKE